MATFKTCWDPPYRSNHQQSVQPRQSPWDLPGQRRSMGVRPYDPPQSRQPSCWEPPPRRASQGYSDYDQPRHSTRTERYEQLIDLLDAATSRMELQFEEIDRRLTKLQASKAPPRRRPTCWDPPFQTSSSHVGESSAPPLHNPPLYGQSPYTNIDSSYVPPRQYTTSTFRQPTYSSDVPPRNSHAEFHQWRHDYKPSRSTSPPQSGHRRLAAPLTVAAAPPPPMRSDRPPMQPSPALPTELPPSATPGAYRPLQPLPMTTPTLAANPHPQAGVPISMKKEGKLLDDVSPPIAVFSAPCSPNISGKEESLLEEGVARERQTVDEEKSTVIVKETILLNGDENGLMEEAVNCLHEVSYPSVMVYALTCAGGSKITREDADRENDDIIERITLIRFCAFDPGICVSFSKRNCEFLAMHMEAMDLQVEDEKLHIDNVLWN